MTGDCHGRICEGLGVKLPRATRLLMSEILSQSVNCRCIPQNAPALGILASVLEQKNEGLGGGTLQGPKVDHEEFMQEGRGEIFRLM